MTLYRVIMAVLLPVLLGQALWRGEGLRDLAERLGFLRPSAGPSLWVHGASNGELTSARWIIADLVAQQPGLQVLVTSNTRTARRMVLDWQMPGVTAALAPLDSAGAAGRVLRRWSPRGLISLEGEVWPARFVAAGALGVPVLMLGARMSARSARMWGRVPGLAARALRSVAHASAQDAGSQANLTALGLPQAALGPVMDLKAQAVARMPMPDALPRSDRAGWLLAASTHEGEEEVVLDAFAASGLTHLILAPRHPRRAPAIAALLMARGIAFAQRSTGAEPGGAAVFLADTLGEMDLWYARCGICLIGGTLADKGGHTPWEPARHGAALLHGPSLHNFARPFADLDAAGAALPVTAATLAQTLRRLDGATQDRMALVAVQFLQALGDGTALIATIRRITAL
jgi:3-deoxy-D-manno-octulosonic-acid transferase